MSNNQENNQTPHVSVVSQYVKDFSFENPDAPKSLTKSSDTPQVDLSLDLNVSKIEDLDGTYEVSINIEAKATVPEMTLFVVELVYAGLFTLENIPEDQVEAVLAIHCPNMIFPFARRMISDITQESGYQPLRIDPIDFARMYHQKLAEQESTQETKN